MTDSFVLVASVLAALAAGLGIAAMAWWMSARGAAAGGAPGAGTRKPFVLLAIAVGLLASVGVLYAVGDRPAPAKLAGAPAPTQAVNALAASLNLGGLPNAGATPAAPAKVGDLDVMTERLAKRLRDSTPNDYEGWALLARSYAELGRDSEAVAAYERAGPLLKSDATLKTELDAAKIRAAMPAAAAAAAANAAAGAKSGKPAETPPVVAGPPVLSGTVDVSPALKAKLPKTGYIFVIARVDGQAGAPLAAKRIPMTALPMNFALTDADSMLPGQKLSGAKTVALSVRVSETGDAAPSSGALESKQESVAVGRKDLALVLSTQRQ